MKKLIYLFIFLFLSTSLFSESLWKNKNIFHGKAYAIGDSMLILFNDKNVLEFSSFQENYESTGLNNPYKTTMVLNFLPQLSGDNKNQSSHKAHVKNKNKLQFTIPASIIEITNKHLKIEAKHKIKINNQIETILIHGEVDPQFIKGGKIKSDKIINLSLEYDRVIYKNPLIQTSDLTNSSSLTNLNLKGARKKELLLQYFNQVLPLLFQK